MLYSLVILSPDWELSHAHSAQAGCPILCVSVVCKGGNLNSTQSRRKPEPFNALTVTSIFLDKFIIIPIQCRRSVFRPGFTGAFSFPSQLSGATHVLSSPGWPLWATLVKDRVSACRFTFADSCTLPLLHPYTFTLLSSPP